MLRFLIPLLAMSSACFAEGPSAFNISVAIEQNTSSLIIKIEDAVESPNACDYYIRHFEYIEALKILIIDLGEEICLVDRFARRKGKLHWTLPNSLRDTGKIGLIVNHKKLGMTIINGEKVQFHTDQN